MSRASSGSEDALSLEYVVGLVLSLLLLAYLLYALLRPERF
jgi:K+-transporting ATPase KdpF subunit